MPNKYQEALNELVHCKLITKCKECKHKSRCTMERDSNIIQELVDKETPMKVIEKMYKYPDVNRTPYVRGFECPNCYQRLHNRYKRPYCAECGQKLDWSDE